MGLLLALNHGSGICSLLICLEVFILLKWKRFLILFSCYNPWQHIARDNTVYNDGDTDSYSSDSDEDEDPTVCEAALSETYFKDTKIMPLRWSSSIVFWLVGQSSVSWESRNQKGRSRPWNGNVYAYRKFKHGSLRRLSLGGFFGGGVHRLEAAT